MSGTSTSSELQRLLQTSSEESGETTPFSWIEEINPPISISAALARLPPAPRRLQETCRQRPTDLGLEPIHTFPTPQGVRARVANVGRQVCRWVAGMTRTMRRWLIRNQ